MSLTPPYAYAATVHRIIDGDTLTVDIDLGFGIWLRDQTFRLVGCNARELAAPGGEEARAFLAALVPAGTVVLLRSIKFDKWGGRYDALIETAGGDLTECLIAGGWAARWNGRGAKPVPAWPRL